MISGFYKRLFQESGDISSLVIANRNPNIKPSERTRAVLASFASYKSTLMVGPGRLRRPAQLRKLHIRGFPTLRSCHTIWNLPEYYLESIVLEVQASKENSEGISTLLRFIGLQKSLSHLTIKFSSGPSKTSASTGLFDLALDLGTARINLQSQNRAIYIPLFQALSHLNIKQLSMNFNMEQVMESDVQPHDSWGHSFDSIARHFKESYRGAKLCKLKIMDMVTLDLEEIKKKCPNLVVVELESPWSNIGWSEELYVRRDWIRLFEIISIQNPRDKDTIKNREFRQYMHESRNNRDGMISLAKSRYEGIQIFDGEGESERIEWKMGV